MVVMGRFIYEDELPEDITDDDYSIWFDNSYVDGVRMGPSPEDLERIKQGLIEGAIKYDL